MNDVDEEGVCDGTREQKSTRSIFECSLFRVVVATLYFSELWGELLEVLRSEVTCQLENTMDDAGCLCTDTDIMSYVFSYFMIIYNLSFNQSSNKEC